MRKKVTTVFLFIDTTCHTFQLKDGLLAGIILYMIWNGEELGYMYSLN